MEQDNSFLNPLEIEVDILPEAREILEQMKGISGASERQIVEYCLAVGNTVMLKQRGGYQIVFISNEKLSTQVSGNPDKLENYNVTLDKVSRERD